MKSLFLFFTIFCFTVVVVAQEKPDFFVLPQKPIIAIAGTDALVRQLAEEFAVQIGLVTGRDTKVFAGNFRVKNGINFIVSKDPKLGKNGYFLEVSSSQIIITAEQFDGFENGLIALKKAMPSEILSTVRAKNIKWLIPCFYSEIPPR